MGFLEYLSATSYTGLVFYIVCFGLAIYLNIKVYNLND